MTTIHPKDDSNNAAFSVVISSEEPIMHATGANDKERMIREYMAMDKSIRHGQTPKHRDNHRVYVYVAMSTLDGGYKIGDQIAQSKDANYKDMAMYLMRHNKVDVGVLIFGEAACIHLSKYEESYRCERCSCVYSLHMDKCPLCRLPKKFKNDVVQHLPNARHMTRVVESSGNVHMSRGSVRVEQRDAKQTF